MKFASIRLIARDIKAVVGFYEEVTGKRADWLAPVFAEIVTRQPQSPSEARRL